MTKASLDVAKIVAEGSAWMTVVHPVTNEETDAKIHLAGADSEAFRKVERRIKNSRFSKLLKGNKNKPNITAEELEENSLDLLVAVTLGWENVLSNGQPLEFNEANVRTLYEDCAWLREQVDEFIGDRTNFLSS